MAIDTSDGIWTISCDECLNVLEADRSLAFGDLVVRMKELGWQIKRRSNPAPWDPTTVKHVCPDHASSSSNPIASAAE